MACRKINGRPHTWKKNGMLISSRNIFTKFLLF
jgi:hypothetical protein